MQNEILFLERKAWGQPLWKAVRGVIHFGKQGMGRPLWKAMRGAAIVWKQCVGAAIVENIAWGGYFLKQHMGRRYWYIDRKNNWA